MLARPEESLALYALCRATEWHVLPESGGLLDQPDWFLHDMVIIGQRYSHLRKKGDKGKKALEALRKGR